MRYSRNQLSKALVAATRLLKKLERPVAKVAEILNPYMDCKEVTGATPQEQEEIRTSIFALMGHAYRREDNAQLAAQWYRRASLISPGTHAMIFARMVCLHQLTDFYHDALATLEEHQRRRLAKPLMTRILSRIGTWCNSDSRQLARSEKGTLEFLRQRALAKAA